MDDLVLLAKFIVSGPGSVPAPGDAAPRLKAWWSSEERQHREWPGKYLHSPRGMCRWCGTTILRQDGRVNLRRSFCGRHCIDAYRLRADPRVMRRFIYHRDLGICQVCREVFDHFEDDGWQADHINPLWAANGDWTFWDPENLQLLCEPCHQEKTKHDLRRWRKASRQVAYTGRRRANRVG